MRIAYLCPEVETPSDGPLSAHARVGGLARSLALIGHEVAVFTPLGGADVLGDDVTVIELRVKPFEERTAEVLESDPNLGPEAASEARSLYASVLRRRADAPMKQFAPDLVVERSSLFGGAGLTIARKAGIPIIVDVVAPVVDPGASGRTRLRPAWIRNADHLVAATPQLAGWLAGVVRDPEHVHVLAGGIEVEQFEISAGEGETVRARLDLADRQIIGYAGDLDGHADLEPLILALGLLDRRGIDPHLLVAGDGPERGTLEKVVRAVGLTDAVTFVDAPAAGGLPAFLAAFDVAVIPSADDSPEVLGYLAAARPVAAPDTEGHHCLQPGKTAWLYPPADPGTLAITIGMILRNPRWAAELALAGREHVREHHSWEQNARALVGLVGAGDAVLAT